MLGLRTKHFITDQSRFILKTDYMHLFISQNNSTFLQSAILLHISKELFIFIRYTCYLH